MCVEANNPEQIANAILRINSNKVLRNNLIENGLSTSQRFDINSCIQKLNLIVKELV